MKIYILFCAICFNTLNTAWATENSYGMIMIVKGNVKVIKIDEQMLDAKLGLKVFPQDIIVTGKNSRAKIVMSDRNIINVLPDTKLKIEQYVNNENEKNVKLELLEGKIRNNVEQKYDNDKNKFEVKTATAIAGVRGTQFITSFDKIKLKTEVVTLKGEVSFKGIDFKTNTVTDPVIVKRGESSSSGQGAAPEAPKKIAPADFKKIENESVVKKEVNASTHGIGQQPSTGAPPNQIKNEVKQIISNIERKDNVMGDTLKQNLNKPAKVKVVPEQ